MQWKQFLILLVLCVAVAHKVITRYAPEQSMVRLVTVLVTELTEEDTPCDAFVRFVEQAEAQVISCVYAHGFAAAHALARRLIDQIARESRQCPNPKHSVRVANGLSNLKYLKEQLDLEVYQQA